MSRLILDHFRRWGWVLGLCGALEFGLGAYLVGQPNQTSEFWGMLVAMWAGANLLTMDLKNGMARGVAVLPLTTGQIGRGWWLATVAIRQSRWPCCCFWRGNILALSLKPNFSRRATGLAALFNVAWLGVIFTCSSGTPGLKEGMAARPHHALQPAGDDYTAGRNDLFPECGGKSVQTRPASGDWGIIDSRRLASRPTICDGPRRLPT